MPVRRLQVVKVQTVGRVKGVKGVKRRIFFICSLKAVVKQIVTSREGCEGGKQNFIVALVITLSAT